MKKSQKKYLRKNLNDRETIYINNKKHTIPKSIDENESTIRKQIIDKNSSVKKVSARRNKKTSPCVECKHNDQGFCRKYKQWCNLCVRECDPTRLPYVYVYKDKNHKKHIIKY